MSDTYKPFFGGICMLTGMWLPNYNLKMTPDEQRDLMVRVGHICKCGKSHQKCSCAK